jgi:hypothetical protein
MSLLADALQPELVPGVFSAVGPYEDISLSDAIVARGAAYALGFDAPLRRIDLDFRDAGYVAHLVAADCGRLSTSCLQSVASIWPIEDEKAALPWALIRLYYAAFYAGHVVVRLLGSGCCWLEAEHIARLDAVGHATGMPIPFKADVGAYRCAIDNTKLEWTKIGSGTRGGAHEALWKTLDSVLSEVSASILTGPLALVDGRAVMAKIESFRRMAGANGSASWLSRTRNDLQYRLAHQVWHATGIGKHDRLRLLRLSGQWTIDPMGIDIDGAPRFGLLGEFCTACAFVIAVFRVLILRVEERNAGRRGCFVRHGPRAFANYCRLKLE